MSPKVNMNRASDEAVWHAMSQARVVALLATDPEKVLSIRLAARLIMKATVVHP